MSRCLAQLKKRGRVNRHDLPILEMTELEMEMSGAGMAAFPYTSDSLTSSYELAGSDLSTE